MEGEFSNTLIYLIFGIIILLIIVVGIVIYSKLNKPEIDESESNRIESHHGKKLKSKGSLEIHRLIEFRLKQGLEGSISFASEMESLKIRALTDTDSFNQKDKALKLRKEIDLINRYKKQYVNPEFFKSEAEYLEFFEEMSNLEILNKKSTYPLYRFGIELKKNLELGNFALILSFCEQYKGKFKGILSKEKLFNELAKIINETITIICKYLDFYELDQKSKQKAIEDIFRSIRKTLNDDFNKNAIKTSNSRNKNQEPFLPEIKFFHKQYKKLFDLVKATRLEVSEKPALAIDLEPKKEILNIDKDTLSLKFLVRNESNEGAPINQIIIKPTSFSNDIDYKGNKKRVSLNEKGEIIIDFLFETFFFEKINYDRRPKIEFSIQYIYLEEEQVDRVEVILPEIQLAPRVQNPFEDGYSGGGLRGSSDLFVGRQDILREISSKLLNFDSPPPFYVITSLSRTGKTSVLYQFDENPHWLKNKYISVYYITKSSADLTYTFRELYEVIKNKIVSSLNDRISTKKSNEVGPSRWQGIIEFFRINENQIKNSGKRILLLIDEYQTFAGAEDIEGNVAYTKDEFYYQFPEFIKILFDQYRDIVAVILAGYETLAEIQKYNPVWVRQLGGRFKTKNVTNFNKTESDQLVKEHFMKNHLIIDEVCLERIYAYTNGHPYLHVLLSYYTFAELLHDGQFRIDRKVKVIDVDEAAENITGDDVKFLWAERWISQKKETELFLATMGQLSYECAQGENDLTRMPELSIEDLQDYLHTNFDFPFNKLEFLDSPTILKDKNVILENDGNFQLRYPIFAMYAKRAHLLSRVISQNFK